MARMIEALKGGELKQIAALGPPPDSVMAADPPLHLLRAEPEPTATPLSEEMPFIEVGDREKKLTASPDVLAIPVPTPPQAAPVVRLATPPTPEVCLGGISLQPWQRGPVSTHLLAPELVAWHQAAEPLAQQYRDLLAAMPEATESGRVLLFTAACPGAGTTTALLNLAITACRQQPERRVIAVDLHWQRPALGERLGLRAEPGLREVVEGSVALEQALQSSCVPGLQALVGGKVLRSFTPAVIEAVRWIIGWLRERFDLVLLDGPAWHEQPELALLLPACDAVYPVASESEANRQQTQKTWQTIVRRGGRLRGVIQTQR